MHASLTKQCVFSKDLEDFRATLCNINSESESQHRGLGLAAQMLLAHISRVCSEDQGKRKAGYRCPSTQTDTGCQAAVTIWRKRRKSSHISEVAERMPGILCKLKKRILYMCIKANTQAHMVYSGSCSDPYVTFSCAVC